MNCKLVFLTQSRPTGREPSLNIAGQPPCLAKSCVPPVAWLNCSKLSDCRRNLGNFYLPHDHFIFIEQFAKIGM